MFSNKFLSYFCLFICHFIVDNVVTVMQEVLICEAVIPNLPLTVECIAAYFLQERTYRLFISTKEGHLLIYKVTRLKGEPQTKLERTIKSKSKSKPDIHLI